MSAELPDVMLVGLGAVGAICESSYILILNTDIDRTRRSCRCIHYTEVRACEGHSNCEIKLRGGERYVVRSTVDLGCYLTCGTTENGMHVKSLKYGEHKVWRPYRGMCCFQCQLSHPLTMPNDRPSVCSSVEEAADRAYSHVVLVSKLINELQNNAQLLQPLLSPSYTEKFAQPVYVLMQNGMNIEVDLWNAIKALNQDPPKIIGTSVYIGSKLLDKNVVEHSDFVSDVRPLSSQKTSS